MNIYHYIVDKKQRNEKVLVALIDPDKFFNGNIQHLISKINESKIDLIFVGGSLLFTEIENTINEIKKFTNKPIIIFPGNILQIANNADGILLLSMISGRNPDLLIGNHVISAPFLKKSKIEILPTGYILIDGNKKTSVEYISNTKPIPSDKIDIAVATAIAGEMLGLKMIYLEAGSGANNHVSIDMIKRVKDNLSIPLIVGGGIKNVDTINSMFNSGADVVVLGSILENDISFIEKL